MESGGNAHIWLFRGIIDSFTGTFSFCDFIDLANGAGGNIAEFKFNSNEFVLKWSEV